MTYQLTTDMCLSVSDHSIFFLIQLSIDILVSLCLTCCVSCVVLPISDGAGLVLWKQTLSWRIDCRKFMGGYCSDQRLWGRDGYKHGQREKMHFWYPREAAVDPTGSSEERIVLPICPKLGWDCWSFILLHSPLVGRGLPLRRNRNWVKWLFWETFPEGTASCWLPTGRSPSSRSICPSVLKRDRGRKAQCSPHDTVCFTMFSLFIYMFPFQMNFKIGLSSSFLIRIQNGFMIP